jgi:formate hydrogenlyase subunit 3/multisubunit Na+/H+ antiporter MnhD subunit
VLPVSGLVFFLGLFAIAGTPPFSVFASEFNVLAAVFQQGKFLAGIILALLLAIVFAGIAVTLFRMFYTKDGKRGKSEEDGKETEASLSLSREESVEPVADPTVGSPAVNSTATIPTDGSAADVPTTGSTVTTPTTGSVAAASAINSTAHTPAVNPKSATPITSSTAVIPTASSTAVTSTIGSIVDTPTSGPAIALPARGETNIPGAIVVIVLLVLILIMGVYMPTPLKELLITAQRIITG